MCESTQHPPTDPLQDLSRVFDAHAPKLLRIALSLARNRADAEDLLQQTFLTLATKALDYDRSRPLEPWLVGILVRHHRDLRRRASRRVDPDRLRSAEADVAAEAATLLERDELLWREVERLPAPYREVISLCFRDGLDQGQIAERLGRPRSTISTQLQRGLARLRERLPESTVLSTLLAAGAGDLLAAARVRLLASRRPPSLFTATPLGRTALAAVVILSLAAVGWFAIGWDGPEAGAAPESTSTDRAAGPSSAETPDGSAGAGPAGGEPVADPRDAPGREAVAGPAPVRVAVLDQDGQPVANAPLRFLVGVAEPPSAVSILDRGAIRTATTDGAGVAVVESVAAGQPIACVFDDGSVLSDVFRAEPGAIHELRVPVMPIRGKVTDELGHPIAGAKLHFSSAPGSQPGFVAAVTNGRGEYEAVAIKFEAAPVSMWATAEGYGHSVRHDVAFVTAPRVKHLQLSSRESPVGGVVRDAAGRPVAGCDVVLHAANRRGDYASARPTKTDSSGVFDLSVPNDYRAVLGVRAREGAPVQVHVPKGRPWFEIHLEPGATVEGTVAYDDGGPVDGATVALYPRILPGAPRPVFQSTLRLAQSNDGEFEIRHAPVGDVVGVLTVGRRILATRGLSLRPGVTTEWSPRIDRSHSFAGRLTDQDGKPMTRARLCLEPIRDGERPNHEFGATDDEGRFRFDGLRERSYRLHYFGASGPTGAWIDVPRGKQDVEWTLPSLDQSIKGSVTFTGFPRHDDNIAVFFNPVGSWYRVTTNIVDGAFERAGIAPGEYAIEAILETADRFRWWGLGTHRVEPGQALELPAVVAPAAGTLVVRTTPPIDPADVTLGWLKRAGSTFNFWLRDPAPEGGLMGHYTPGEYMMTMCVHGFGVVRTPVTIRPGARTVENIVLRPVRIRELGLDVDGSGTLFYDLWVHLLVERDGQTVLDNSLHLDRRVNNIPLGLTTGSYSVRAVASWGARGSARFEVPEGEMADTDVLRIPLPVR